MAKMMKPEVEAVRFRGGIDVIATSGNPTLTLTGFDNFTAKDGMATLGNAGSYNTSTNVYQTIMTNMTNYLGGQSGDFMGIKIQDYNNKDSDNNSYYYILSQLFDKDGRGDPGIGFNDDGTYTYDPTKTTSGGYIWFTR